MARKKGFVSEINVTPFVDVMMVLLIIFMVTAPMMDSGLDVDLPQAKQVDNLPTDADHLVLTVREDGALFLQADKAVPYGIVVDVMGRIKAAGIERLGVIAMPATDSGKTAKK